MIEPAIRLLVVNCNTSAAMTSAIADQAGAAARPGTVVTAAQPSWGPESAEGFYESFLTAAAVLETLATRDEPFDAVVMAGFGEHGREGARQLLDVPVVDITEAAAALACLVGDRFGVVTTTRPSVALIRDSLATAGYGSRCAGIVDAGIRVLETGQVDDASMRALEARAHELLAAGADCIVLGCSGFASLAAELQRRLGVPVVDGVAAAVGLAETLVTRGLRTSKVGPYAPPDPAKKRPGWPR